MKAKFVGALVCAILLGAALHWLLGERYRFQAVGNGIMIRTDRWTGEAWKTAGYGDTWKKVEEEWTPPPGDLEVQQPGRLVFDDEVAPSK